MIFKNRNIIIVNGNTIMLFYKEHIVETWMFNIMTSTGKNVGEHFDGIKITLLFKFARHTEVIKSLR
jgi:hypothetical protein